MQVLVGKLFPFTIFICLMNIIVLPLVSSSSQQHVKSIDSIADKKDSIHKVSHKLMFEIRLHGFLLWASMGFLMPVGILAIRMSNRQECGTRLKILFYVHVVSQASSSLLLLGSKGRSGWFFAHWLLGTAISILGIINIYTGLRAYHEKTSRSIKPWTIVLTAEISLIAFVYLFQDKWLYIQKQGLILGDESVTPKPQHSSSTEKQNESSSEKC
ncbi:hypothetical protein Golax_016942 [Gossypium laxum]|uniref:Cytochrome b561 domain-containing protein n=1 Tax=Gossypium laxum TaxID=34288 RepID=A0A7J8YYQ7_9ROSI|nr:hypothetical protein [Gossypium laxum]